MMKRTFTQVRYILLLCVAVCCTASAVGQQFVTIPTANTNSSSGRQPYGNWYGYQRSAQIYTAAEIGKADTIKSLAFYVNSISSPAASTPVKIYLKERATNTFAAGTAYATEISGAKLVYTGNVLSSELVANQWITKTLDSAFYFSNTQALEVIIETNGGGGGIEGQFAKQFRLSTTGSNNRAQNWNQDTNPPTGTGTTTTSRPNIIIGFPPPPPCSGAPTAGATVATSNPVCPTVSTTLSTAGTNSASGITYQWLSSTDGVTYTVVNAATSATYATTLTANTYFKSVLTCSNTSQTDTSTALLVTVNSFNQCYCVPASSTCTASDRIDSVIFAGIANSSSCSTNGYASYSTPVGSANRFATLPISVKVGPGGTEYVGVWIDYDHSGTFDASEFKAIGSGNGVTISNTITIPGTALLGVTGMRVRVKYNVALTGTDGCTTIANGETEDYQINILDAPACSTVDAGTTVVSSTAGCPGQAINLSISTSNTTSGITYQWISSTDGISYSNVNGATANTLVDTFTVAKYYRLIVTCAGASTTDTSDAVQVTANPFYNCYCTPGTSACGGSDRIDSVNFAGIVSPSATGCSTNGYISYSTPVGSALKGTTYPISVKVGPGGTEYVGVWIDYNHNSVFDSSEYKYIGTGNGVVITNSITIPNTAQSGITRMRVRVRYNTNHTANDACLTYATGETEDYLINIQTPPACTGATAGITASTVDSACATIPFTLSISGANNFDGITYQWLSSADGVNYTLVNGANSSTLTTTISASTYFRNVVSCSYSSTTDTSTVKFVKINAYQNCYCVPGTSDCTDGDLIDSLSFAGINRASGCVTNGYSFTTTPVASAMKTLTYPIAVHVGDAGGFGDNESVAIWIDYDHSGTFDTSEFKSIGYNYSTTLTSTVTIPAGAQTGITRMRVRARYSTVLTSSMACTTYTYGETEDYLINIVDLPACTNPPVAGTISGDTTLCAGASSVLTASGYTLGTQLQWQKSTNNTTWTDVAGATSTTLTTDTFSVPVYYRVKVTCLDSAFTNALHIVAAPSYECYCAGFTQDCSDGDVIVRVQLNNLDNTTGFACNAGGYTMYSSPVDTVYTGNAQPITVTVGDGGTENISIWIDYNQNGVFDTTEYTFLGSGSDEDILGSINIPANASTGLTVMRIRNRWLSTLTNDQACYNGYTYGETEDYLIYIAPPPPCLAPVVAGTINGPSVSQIDSTETFVLTGFNGNIQWQYSNTTAAGPYINFVGSTNDSIDITFLGADTFYVRAYVTFLGCDPDSTAPFQVIVAKKAGDDVCDAIQLNIGVNGPFSTSGASVQPGEVSPPGDGCGVQTGWCNDDINNTLWFKFTAPASGRVRIYSPDTQGDSRIALWDAPSCDSLLSATGATLIAANDDYPNYASANVPQYSGYIDSAICLTPGKTYYIQLDNYTLNSAVVSTVVINDLGAGPVAAFTNLDTAYCVNAAPVTLTPAGGTFTGAGVTGNVFNPATAGVGGPYVITRTYYACYTYSDTVYAVNAAPALTVVDTTDVLCNGGNTGAVDVAVTGGTTPYTFAWTGGTTNEDLSGVIAGNYNVTVTDAKGCSATGAATVAEPAALFLGLDSTVQVACPGGATGAAYVTVSGGVSPYTYVWSNGATTEDITGLAAGQYTLTVTDANNCTIVSNAVTITQPAPISIIVISTTNVNCNGGSNGGVNITVTGGNAPYTYLWSNGVTTQDITNATAGTYTPTITDNKGCTLVGQTFTITEPAVLAITVDSTNNASCSTNSDGDAYVTVSGGTTPYSYNWSNSTSQQDLVGVPAGTYTLTVTDSHQCSATAQAVVGANAAITVTVDSIHNAICAGGSTGAVYITAASGVAPYIYTWSNSTTAEDLANVPANTYTVTVNDGNGCSITATATVGDGYALNAVVDSVKNASCNGGANGAIYITPTNGVAPYVPVWSGGGNTLDIANLSAGTYTLTLTDANGCVYSGLSASVTAPTAVVLTSVVTDQVGTANNGAIDVTVSGGTAPYGSVWSNSSTIEDLTAISAGIYTTTVTDANGCTASKTDTVDFITGIDVVNGTYTVAMYPNPTMATATVTVNLENANDVTVEVFNVAGQLITNAKEYGVSKATFSFDFTNQAAGVYNTKITIGDKVITKRLVVNK